MAINVGFYSYKYLKKACIWQKIRCKKSGRTIFLKRIIEEQMQNTGRRGAFQGLKLEHALFRHYISVTAFDVWRTAVHQ
jgi:hypothetical protein